MNKKALLGLAAAATVAVGTVAAPSDAHAQWRRGGWGPGAVIGGLAAGAIIGGALAAPYYYGGPAPVYAAPGYDGPECRIVRQRVVDSYGVARVRRVEVCD